MKPLSKKELMRQMKRFIADKDRGISIPLFAEVAGIHHQYIYTIFQTETYPLSEYYQLRVSKALQSWMAGELRVMQHKRKKYVEYRREPKPPLMQSMGLRVTPDGIKIKVGMVNRHDYSELDLNEALRG